MLRKSSPFIVRSFCFLVLASLLFSPTGVIPARAAVSVLYAKSSAAGTLPGQRLHPANHLGNRRAGQ